MSGGRIFAVARQEIHHQVRSPLFWLGVFVIVLTTSAMSPTTLMPSGDAAVGGLVPYGNSMHGYMQLFGIGGFFALTFIAAIIGGLPVIRDDELRYSELVRSTPLSSLEYVIGKFGGVFGALLLLVVAQALTALWMVQLSPFASASMVRGPFSMWNVLLPALFVPIPLVAFSSGLAFFIGERTGRPLTVYVLPVVLFLVVINFLWMWHPLGLSAATDRFLMMIDPTGLRWITDYYSIDQGVAHYNSSPVGFDLGFIASRILMVAIPCALVLSTARHRRKLSSGGAAKWRLPFGRVKKTREAAGSNPAFSTLSDLGMSIRPPGFLLGAIHLIRGEIRELRGQVGLYLLIPFAAMMVTEFSTGGEVAGSGPVLTSGTSAVGGIGILTGIICFVLLFYTVESVLRDKLTGFATISNATPIKTGSILLARAAVNALLVTAIVVASMALGLLSVASQGTAPPEPWPFILVWGLILAPTYFFWSALVTAIAVGTRDRYLSYAIGLAMLAVSVVFLMSGQMTWATNWPLWGTLRWSDMSSLSLNAWPLALNRVLVTSLGILLTLWSASLFSRTESDAMASMARRRPSKLFRRAIRWMPLALVPLATGAYLSTEVNKGFQGADAESLEIAYRTNNEATWRDHPLPEIRRMDLQMELDPSDRSLSMNGSFKLINRTDGPLQAIPVTGLGFQEPAWTLDRAPIEPTNRAGLFVLDLATPLSSGDSLELGFQYRTIHPQGMTRNGGGTRQFILESGAVLYEFLPRLGFDDGIGRHPERQPKPKAYPEDYWTGQVPASGTPPFHARVEVVTPEAWGASSVGKRVWDTVDNGLRTTVFETDAPVGAISVLAGRWEEESRDGVTVKFHPEHTYNVDEMLDGLVAARDRYSEWFHPYPWKELRLSEYPGLNQGARSYPTSVAFSESSGFLTRSGPGASGAFTVVAHEAAHQWWPHLLVPGEAPGADVMIEGMAHFSTLLLHESENGLRGRIEFALQMEEAYFQQREVDREQPLFELVNDGTPATESAIYNKGAWAMWMLANELGREALLSGLRTFIRDNLDTEDYPTLQDLTQSLRSRAPDSVRFDALVATVFGRTAAPEYRFTDSSLRETESGWRVDGTLQNAGSGFAFDVVVAAESGDRFVRTSNQPAEQFLEERIAIRLAPGESKSISLEMDFKPERLVVDPDALVLQSNRGSAVREFR